MAAASCGAAASQTPLDPRIASVIAELEKTRDIHQVALSPDGQMIAWAVDAQPGIEIQVAPTADPSHSHRLTAGTGAACTEEDLAWSPDSKSLAFTSDCNSQAGSSDQADVYLVTPAATGASARRLTHLHGGITSLAFSPDGLHIAWLYIEGATRPAGALAPMKPPAGVIGVEGLEIQRVATVETASGEFRQVSPAKLHVYEYDWGPDSRQLAFVAAPPPGENNWWVAQLYTQPLTGGQPRAILDPEQTPGPLHGLQIAVPRWSPSGDQIAFIGGLMSDQGVTGGDIYLLPASGGEPKDITPKADKTAVWIHWVRPSPLYGGPLPAGSAAHDWLLVSWVKSGQVELGNLDAANGASKSYQTVPASVSDGRLEQSLSIAHGAMAYIKSSFSEAPEVYLDVGEPAHPITHYNDALKPLWGKSKSMEWTSDTFPVQGWLLYPAHYDPAKKYPLIVSVHGGPSSEVQPRWPDLGYNPIAFSALDYFVLMPNPRGSYGEGEAFTQANRKDFGYGDLRDILAGVDAASAEFPIDQQRIGLTGWSYGGFMTMFAVTQTQRFHAAVAGAGISNWQSYYGENSIDQWMTPFFGASVYNDPAVYAKSSAIDFIRNVKTPTLVVVGDRDGECPMPQSFEFWHALRAEHVPTELVVYPDEGHRFDSPQHRRDVLARALAWFEKYMPAQS
ncbi:MAG TPA: S9 family peptidase [Acidobacteriaceae bacterium]|nr:S9 family peptidase [Acidobacteriaceae bacterium]